MRELHGCEANANSSGAELRQHSTWISEYGGCLIFARSLRVHAERSRYRLQIPCAIPKSASSLPGTV